MFWRSGNGKLSVLAYREWQEKFFGVAGIARKVVTFTPGAGVVVFGGSPQFEEATSTPGTGLRGFGGSPPIRRCDIHPWRGSGGFGGSPPF